MLECKVKCNDTMKPLKKQTRWIGSNGIRIVNINSTSVNHVR